MGEPQIISSGGYAIETSAQAQTREQAEAQKHEGNVGYFYTVLEQERVQLISQINRPGIDASEKQKLEKRLDEVAKMQYVLYLDVGISALQVKHEAKLGILTMMPDQKARYKPMAMAAAFREIPYNELLNKLNAISTTDESRQKAIDDLKVMIMKKRTENVTVK